jgi:hypothetical protein
VFISSGGLEWDVCNQVHAAVRTRIDMKREGMDIESMFT